MNFFKFCLHSILALFWCHFFLEVILGFEVSILIFVLGLAVIVR